MSMSENFCSLSMSVYRALDLAGINLDLGFPLQSTQELSNLLSNEFAFDFLKIIAGKVKVEAYLDTLTTCIETSFGKEKSQLNPLLSRKKIGTKLATSNNIFKYIARAPLVIVLKTKGVVVGLGFLSILKAIKNLLS